MCFSWAKCFKYFAESSLCFLIYYSQMSGGIHICCVCFSCFKQSKHRFVQRVMCEEQYVVCLSCSYLFLFTVFVCWFPLRWDVRVVHIFETPSVCYGDLLLPELMQKIWRFYVVSIVLHMNKNEIIQTKLGIPWWWVFQHS